MLWSSRKATGYVLVFCGLFMLAGCGFRPLNNEPSATSSAAGENIRADLATIHIKPIKDRVGQQLRNLLLSRLNPTGGPAQPLYNLHISLTESVQQLGIKKSSFATRANLLITARYWLTRTPRLDAGGATGEAPEKLGDGELAKGSVQAISSYDISAYQFTTLTAQRDARRRAVREIADDLRTRIAVYFAQHRMRN